MVCPICHREITATINGKILRHGFKKDRWVLSDEKYIRVDGGPCAGSGKIGLAIVHGKPTINELED